MADLDNQLRTRCREEPEKTFQVVVTLESHAKHMKATDLGLSGLEAIPGLPGMLKGQLTGHDVLTLGEKPGVKEIIEDFEVSALE